MENKFKLSDLLHGEVTAEKMLIIHSLSELTRDKLRFNINDNNENIESTLLLLKRLLFIKEDGDKFFTEKQKYYIKYNLTETAKELHRIIDTKILYFYNIVDIYNNIVESLKTEKAILLILNNIELFKNSRFDVNSCLYYIAKSGKKKLTLEDIIYYQTIVVNFKNEVIIARNNTFTLTEKDSEFITEFNYPIIGNVVEKSDIGVSKFNNHNSIIVKLDNDEEYEVFIDDNSARKYDEFELEIIDDREMSDSVKLKNKFGYIVLTESYFFEFPEDVLNDGDDEYDSLIKIENLFVLPKFRNMGYGKKFMLKALEYIEENMHNLPIMLNASNNHPGEIDNDDLELFYNKLGFHTLLDEGNKLMIRRP